jgi:hypothetical protein
MGIGTPWKAALLLAVGAAGGATAVAVANVPDGNGVIHACVRLSGTLPITSGANVRVIDTGAGQTCSSSTPAGTPSEASVNWNVTGPAGPQGTNGAPGAPGKTVTLLGGNTLTLPGGQVLHVGQSAGLTINPPAVGSRPIATLTISDGRSTITSSVLGFAFAASAAGTTGSAAKRATVRDLQITKHIDKSSPTLFKACVTGKHFKKAQIVLKKGKHTTTYTLVNVLISSAQASSSKGSAQPTESLSLNYTKIEYKSS